MQNSDPQISILSRISADALAQACCGFPPASIAKDDFMSGIAKDPNGREVVVTFQRKTFKRHKAQWQAWCIYEARYKDNQ